MAKQIEYNAKVTSRIEINPFLIILGVTPSQPFATFKPGQYATLALKASAPRVHNSTPEANPKEGDVAIQRAYSIASANTTKELEFYLALVTAGELTPRLFALKVGDPVYISAKPVGLFTLERVEEGKSLIFMATGTGLAPYISMLRSQMDQLKNKKVVVLQGARHVDDLGYRDELEAIAKKHSNIIYMPVLSQGAKNPSWKGLNGYLQDTLFSGEVEKRTGLKVTPENFDVFICGNPAMIKSAIEKLSAVGFILAKGKTPGTIHIEEYW